MVSICLEYVEGRADKIFIYCSYEEGFIASDFFYCINGSIVRKHKLNDCVCDEDFRYDTSGDRQIAVMDIINEDIEKLYELCNEYNKEMPTEIKMVYDVKENRLRAAYQYNLVYTNDLEKTADDIAMEWFEEEKSRNENNKL